MFQDRRFLAAMGAYAALALGGSMVLTGKMRVAIWIFFAALAIKTIIVVASRKNDE